MGVASLGTFSPSIYQIKRAELNTY